MMKQSILFFLIGYSFLSLLNYEEKKENDLKKEGLHGKVKLLIQYDSVYYEYFNYKPKPLGHNRVFKFDENGNLIEKIQDLGDDHPYYKEIYKYNELGKIILYIEERELIPPDSIDGNAYITTDTLIYNNLGDLIESRFYCNGCKGTKYTYKRDLAGNIIEKIQHDVDGQKWKTDFKYDKNKNLIEEWHHNAEGLLNIIIVYKYDKKGNKIEVKIIESNGSINSQENYEYDEHNNIIVANVIGHSPDMGKKIKLYDKEDNVIEEKFYYGETLKSITSNKYIYDKNGNWVKKTVSIIGSKGFKEHKRTIEYY